MITARKVRIFFTPGLKPFKMQLFERLARATGGPVKTLEDLERLPADQIPAVGGWPPLRPLLDRWQASGRPWLYWDRGYLRRSHTTWLPRGTNGGYYRWHLNDFQMRRVVDRPDDRLSLLRAPPGPWRREGEHIVVAAPSETYAAFHGIPDWTAVTVARLRELTRRPVRIREKNSQTPLGDDLRGAHALVTHGSVAAVEAVMLGCPVFVDPSCAAAAVGRTELVEIERPRYPDRTRWLRSLAYCQFTEEEMFSGNIWGLLDEGSGNRGRHHPE